VVAEPPLHRSHAAALREQARRHGVAERVEAGPVHPRFAGRGSQNALVDVVAAGVASLECERLGAAHAGGGEQLEREPMSPMDEPDDEAPRSPFAAPRPDRTLFDLM
jgi:hypothetical protein